MATKYIKVPKRELSRGEILYNKEVQALYNKKLETSERPNSDYRLIRKNPGPKY